MQVIWRRRTFVFVAVVLLVAFAILFATWNQPSQEPQKPSDSVVKFMPAAAVTKIPQAVEASASPSQENLSAQASAKKAALDELRERIQQEFHSAANLKSFFDKYSSAEYASNGAAQFYTSRAIATCILFLDMSSEQVMNGIFTRHMRENPEVQPRIQALSSLSTRCSGFTGAATVKDMQARLNESARLLEPAALAAKLFDIERSGMSDEALSIARQVLRSPNGDIVDGLINYFTYRTQPWTIGDTGEVPLRDLSADAWRLAACEWGIDCGPTMPSLLEACWTKNQCNFTSYQDYLQRARYSPLEFEKLMQLRVTIISAVSSSNWGVVGLLPSRRSGK